jgi:DNA modification methylase
MSEPRLFESEANEGTEPYGPERTEAHERAARVESTDHRERVEESERAAKIERAEWVASTESSERAEARGSAEPIERAETREGTDVSERAVGKESPESVSGPRVIESTEEPEPFLADPDVTLYEAEALAALRQLPDESVHMAVTSPPFYGLRDYGTGGWEGGDPDCDHKPPSSPQLHIGSDGKMGRHNTNWDNRHGAYGPVCERCGAFRVDAQIGLEATLDEWLESLVAVFREVRRVLRRDGTLWLEIGDSYAGGGMGVKPKDLLGQPWLLALALRADGWYLRSCIIWARPNPMPESARDRPTTSHSYVFLLTRSSRYFYDAEAVREPHQEPWRSDGQAESRGFDYQPYTEDLEKGRAGITRNAANENRLYNPIGRNIRSVWTIPTEANALTVCRVCDYVWQSDAPRTHCGKPVVQHYAAFPQALVERCVKAATSEHGVCAECGAPWRRVVRPVGEYAEALEEGFWRKGESDIDPLVGGRGSGKPSEACGFTRTVETIGWEPTCEHRSDLPEALVEKTIRAGTSEEGVCAECGAPWERVVEQGEVAPGYTPGETPAFHTRRFASATGGFTRGAETIGWRPTCQHRSDLPEALVEKTIRAGTPEQGVCAECGAPWERIIETHYQPVADSPDAIERQHGEAHAEEIGGPQSWKYGRAYRVDTLLGWRPTCEHPEKKHGVPSGWDTAPGAHGTIHREGRSNDGSVPVGRTETVGWKETCEHAPAPVPATVLDPFMGSGTTAVVARRLGRRAIGIDLNRYYCLMASARLRQQSLFA